MKAIFPAALFLVVFVLAAAPVRGASDSPNLEIASLLNVVGTSQCQFYRNGTWYDASKAQDHLQKKYNFYRKIGLAGTAEQFIDNVGTKSSISGEAYQVRCGDAPTEPCAQWLREQLQRLRSDQNGKQMMRKENRDTDSHRDAPL